MTSVTWNFSFVHLSFLKIIILHTYFKYVFIFLFYQKFLSNITQPYYLIYCNSPFSGIHIIPLVFCGNTISTGHGNSLKMSSWAVLSLFTAVGSRHCHVPPSLISKSQKQRSERENFCLYFCLLDFSLVCP